jgi:hypothetical protein
MEKKSAKLGSAILSLFAIVLLVIGIFFFIGGIFFPKGDIIAIGLGIELQVIGLAIILFQKK